MALEVDLEKRSPSSHIRELRDSSTSDNEGPVIADVPEFDAPDGGVVAWSQVFVSLLVNMLSFGYPSAFGVYQLYYRDNLGLPEAQISWIGSVQTFLAFSMCTISGRLADAGYIRSTVVGGSSLVVLGTFTTSLATEYWQIFLSQGICTGLGLGVMFMPPLTVVSSYFRSKRSYALAVTAMGTGTGSVIFPAVVQYLIPQVGFPWAVRYAGFVALFIAAVSVTLIRPRLAPRKAGPLIEWGAFKEVPYLLYTLGSFLFFWALYFGLFFVRLAPFSVK